MHKISRILTVLLCAALAFTCVTPVSTGEREETKTTSLDVMLVVDDTVSMQDNDPNRIASLALQKFVDKIPGEGSRIGMATYDDDILTSIPIKQVRTASDMEELKTYAQTHLTQDGRFTDLPGALLYAVEQIQGLKKADSAPAIIAVSDGENDFINDAAEARSDAALETVLNAGIPVYLIVINASNTSGVRKYMEGIASATGGEALFVESGNEIDLFLVSIANRLYGFEYDSENQLNTLVGAEPVEWAFPLNDGIFEANLELTHTAELEMELFGPDKTQIPLQGNEDVVMSSIPDREGIKTTIRLLEPDAGDYVMKLSSPGETQYVIGEIILNSEIYVQVDLSADSAQKGDAVEVTASLMRGGERYENLEFTNLKASVLVNGQSEEMERDDSANVFRYELTVSDQKSDLEVVVVVEGQKSFKRSSDPVTITIESSGRVIDPNAKPSSKPSSSSDPNPSENDPIPLSTWIIIAVVILLAAVILIVAVVFRDKIVKDGPQYIRLQGTLSVACFDNAYQHMWERYVQPGSYYTKRAPRAPLGKMLRDLHYDDIPDYFDNIQVAGLQYKDGRLCVEVTDGLSSGTKKSKRYIEVPNGRGMDEMGGFGSFDAVPSSVDIDFPDGTHAKLSFMI